MTETAEQTKQDEATAQERDSFIKRERERAQAAQQAVAEEAARVREGWRSQWEKDNVSNFVTPQTLNMFSSLWQGVDAMAVEFAAGISNITDIKQDKKAPHVHLLTSKFGSEFAYVNKSGQEFIGLTARQARKTPLNENAADDIALTAFARGWKSVTVSGNAAEKDMLWIAAQKYGLAVTNHIPSPEARQAYEASKNAPEVDSTTAGMGAGTTMPVKVETALATTAQPRSRYQEQDITDAEWEEVKKPALPAPQTRYLLTHDKGDDDNKPGPNKPAGPNGP